MQPELWRKIESVLEQAVQLPASERECFINEACGSDFVLRNEVISLINEAETRDGFLSDPVFTIGFQLLNKQTLEQLQTKNLGSYQILRLLGRGGMGEVYLANDSRLERPVALKILSPLLAANEEAVLRFQQEAKLASSISHPNVAHIYESGFHSDRYFLAMEYVAGKTLRQLLKEKAVEEARAVEIAVQIAQALTAAHKVGVVHRDIKPENVMVTDEGLVKVLDFGLAKLSLSIPPTGSSEKKTTHTSLETSPGQVIGTTAYMSPEQARGQKLDERTDLWSLGVAFYEMLTGKRPFTGETPSDIQAAILLKEPPPLESQIAPELETILQRALKKDLSERYQTAMEMLKDLRLAQKLLNESVANLENQQFLPFATEANRKEISGTKINGNVNAAKGFKYILSRALFISGFALLLISLFAIALFLNKNKTNIKNLAQAPAVNRAVRLTNSGSAIRAAISPDGEAIAYVLDEAGLRGIFMRRRNSAITFSSQVSTLVPPAERIITSLAFSPDSQQVYFRSRKIDARLSTLYKTSINGGEPEKVIDDISSAPSFSPDGKQMVFLRLSSDASHETLLIANTDGTDERVILARRMPEFIPHSAQPAWSPDGQTIICAVGKYEDKGEKVVPLAIRVSDGRTQPIFDDKWEEIWHLDWLGDGSGFIMTGRKDRTYDNKQLWRVAYPSGDVTRLTNDANDYYTISVSRRSGEAGVDLATIVLNRTAQLWKVNLADSEKSAVQLTSDGNDDGYGVSWAHGMSKIFYGSITAGNPDIWTMNDDGTNRRQLTTNDHLDSQPTVTPDRKHVIFGSFRSGVKSLWRMNLDGSDQVELVHGAEYEPLAISPDSKTVYYHSYFDGAAALWRVDVSGGHREKLLTGNYYPSAISADGKLIAASYRSNDSSDYSIVLLATENGLQTVRTFKPVAGTQLPNWIRWSRDGKRLVYIATNKGISNLWGQPLDGSPAKQLTNFTSNRIYSFDWSADGKQIICARGELAGYVALLTVN